MRRRNVVGLLLFAVGCTAAPSASALPDTPSPSPSVAVSPLVGEWVGIHNCKAIVHTLRSAGFEGVVLDIVIDNGLVPGAGSKDDLADQSMPCEDAVPREHEHIFTADGQFGSRDWNGNPVDDGTYEIVDEDTLIIEGIELGYSIEGDELKLESIPKGCEDDECIYSIMLAMPGETMHREED
jgi:hypothetical protein